MDSYRWQRRGNCCQNLKTDWTRLNFPFLFQIRDCFCLVPFYCPHLSFIPNFRTESVEENTDALVCQRPRDGILKGNETGRDEGSAATWLRKSLKHLCHPHRAFNTYLWCECVLLCLGIWGSIQHILWESFISNSLGAYLVIVDWWAGAGNPAIGTALWSIQSS